MVWGLPCLACFLGDLGFGAQTANLLQEREEEVGGSEAELRCPCRGDSSYLVTMPFVFLVFNSF